MRSDLSRKRGEVNSPYTLDVAAGRLSSCFVPPRILTRVSDRAGRAAARPLPSDGSRRAAGRRASISWNCWQKARDDRSALLIAPTGAGKTLAGFLPTLVELTAPHPRCALPPPPRSGGEGSGVGGLSARTTASELAEAPPTPDPSPPRAARAGGGERRAARHVTAAAQRRPAHPLHLALESARGRYRAQSGDADRRDGPADQGRDPHRRHAGVAAAAAAALSAGYSADHARATGAAAVVRRRAVPVRLAQAHRARRTARAGDLQARRSVVARAGAAVAAGAADARDRAVGHGRRAGIAGALPGAAARRQERSRRHRRRRRCRGAHRRDARHQGAAAMGRAQRAPRAQRSLRADQGATRPRWCSSTPAARPRCCSRTCGG